MKPLKFFLLFFSIYILTSCKDHEDYLPYEEKFFIQYGDSLIETREGLLYLYDKIDGEYYYTVIAGNSGYTAIGWNVSDTYSRGDYIKLHFKGDSITNLLGRKYQIINDSNNYIVFDYNDTLNTYSLIDYIDSGEIYVNSNYFEYPLSIAFDGITQTGKSITMNYYISSPEVSYKLTRQVIGDFRFNNEVYELSSASVLWDTTHYDLFLNDLDIEDSIALAMRILLNKENDDQFTGSYYGLGPDTIGPNSFSGDISIRSLEGHQRIYRFFNQGEIKINNTYGNNYTIDFKICTEENDSIVGSWESVIERFY